VGRRRDSGEGYLARPRRNDFLDEFFNDPFFRPLLSNMPRRAAPELDMNVHVSEVSTRGGRREGPHPSRSISKHVRGPRTCSPRPPTRPHHGCTKHASTLASVRTLGSQHYARVLASCRVLIPLWFCDVWRVWHRRRSSFWFVRSCRA
jgi:hypothetical protein